jgi:hypothetical protein
MWSALRRMFGPSVARFGKARISENSRSISASCVRTQARIASLVDGFSVAGVGHAHSTSPATRSADPRPLTVDTLISTGSIETSTVCT